MDVTVTSSQPNQGANSTTNLAGTAAPKTEGQAADLKAERVVQAGDSAKLENAAKQAEETRFNNIKRLATQYSAGKNPYLNDVSFTVYNGSQAGNTYEIRFTDISSGIVDVKSEAELVSLGSSGGNIVEGTV